MTVLWILGKDRLTLWAGGSVVSFPAGPQGAQVANDWLLENSRQPVDFWPEEWAKEEVCHRDAKDDYVRQHTTTRERGDHHGHGPGRSFGTNHDSGRDAISGARMHRAPRMASGYSAMDIDRQAMGVQYGGPTYTGGRGGYADGAVKVKTTEEWTHYYNHLLSRRTLSEMVNIRQEDILEDGPFGSMSK